MCSHFKHLFACIFLLCHHNFTLAQEQINPVEQQPIQSNQYTCYFYEYTEGSNELSDPANQARYFIKNNWIALENDLARGHGEALSYLRKLTVCSYALPNQFWQSEFKGLPFEAREPKFIKLFSKECFCAR